MKKIVMLSLLLSIMLYPKLSREDNGIVTDSSTKLAWQDDYKGTLHGDFLKIQYSPWGKSITYCEKLRLGGYNDWRLPTYGELISLIDMRYTHPTIDPIFQSIESVKYWSSTTHHELKTYAGGVYFYTGLQFYYIKKSNNYVRCVRSIK